MSLNMPQHFGVKYFLFIILRKKIMEASTSVNVLL